MLPPRFAPMLFGLILSGLMSLLITGIATWRSQGLADASLSAWGSAWLTARPIAFPCVLLLAGTAFAQYSSGRWEEALTSLKEAQRLDPRSGITARRLTRTLIWLRHYPEATEAAERSLALTPADPTVIEARAMVALGQGDLAGARASVRRAPKDVDPTALVSYIAQYWDLYWLLDDEYQALLLRIPRAQFDNALGWALAFAQTYDLRGDSRRAKAYADTAVALAYAVQQYNNSAAIEAGQRPVGRKIGLTSRAVQQQLGVDQPDFGQLFASMARGDDQPITWLDTQQPKVEAEIALVLEHDLCHEHHTLADLIRATAFALSEAFAPSLLRASACPPGTTR